MDFRIPGIIRVFVFSLMLLPLLASAGSSAAQVGDPYALLDAVNQLRAANGLAPYQMNSALMISAQSQSEYQASLGTWTHTGPGGTDETQRAVAAGYGGGASVMCDENVAFGLNLSAQGCADVWTSDAPHLNNMLSTRYVEAGTGATTDVTGRVFYTLDVCYIVGSISLNSVLPQGTTATLGPTLEPFFGVQTVTPAADGALVHTVKAGQNLNLIAAAYGVTLDEIKKLNNLTSDMIRPGDQLIIRAASPATPTLEATNTPTRPPATSTRRPTRTPTLQPPALPTLEESPLPSATPTRLPVATGDVLGNVLLIAVVLLVVAGGLMVVLGGLLKRRS